MDIETIDLLSTLGTNGVLLVAVWLMSKSLGEQRRYHSEAFTRLLDRYFSMCERVMVNRGEIDD